MQQLKYKHEPFTIVEPEPPLRSEPLYREQVVEDLSFKDKSDYVAIPRKWIFYILVAFCVAKLALGAALVMYADYKIEQKLKQTNSRK